MEIENVIEELKVSIVKQLNLEDVDPNDVSADDPLFGDGFGLDSIDALELVVLIQKGYGIKIEDPEKARDIFRSVRTLAEFIVNHKSAE